MAAACEKLDVVRSLTEQALRTGLGYTVLYRGLLAGQVAAIRQGGRWYLRDKEADRFAASYRAPARDPMSQPA